MPAPRLCARCGWMLPHPNRHCSWPRGEIPRNKALDPPPPPPPPVPEEPLRPHVPKRGPHLIGLAADDPRRKPGDRPQDHPKLCGG